MVECKNDLLISETDTVVMEAALERQRQRRAKVLSEVGSAKTPSLVVTDEFGWRSGKPGDKPFAQVLPGLYVGSAKGLSEDCLAEMAATHVLSLSSSSAVAAGRTHLTLSVDDSKDALLPLRESSEFITQARGGCCFVHCGEGISRAPATLIGHLMLACGMNLIAAMRAVRAVRPVARPNAGFMRQLILFELELYGKASMEIDSDGRYIPAVG